MLNLNFFSTFAQPFCHYHKPQLEVYIQLMMPNLKDVTDCVGQ